jgi:hypothetical protein
MTNLKFVFEDSRGKRRNHWYELDEDISVEGVLLGNGDQNHYIVQGSSIITHLPVQQ